MSHILPEKQRLSWAKYFGVCVEKKSLWRSSLQTETSVNSASASLPTRDRVRQGQGPALLRLKNITLSLSIMFGGSGSQSLYIITASIWLQTVGRYMFRLTGGHRGNTLKKNTVSLGSTALAFCVNYPLVCLYIMSLREKGCSESAASASCTVLVYSHCSHSVTFCCTRTLCSARALKTCCSYLLSSKLHTYIDRDQLVNIVGHLSAKHPHISPRRW